MKPIKKQFEDGVSCATKITQRVDRPEVSAKAGVAEHFRRLKWNELVCRGDFVADEYQRLQPWEGPNGFRADAFVRPIYLRDGGTSAATKHKNE